MTRDDRRALPPHLDPRAGRGSSGQAALPTRGRRSLRAVVLARSVAALVGALVLAGSGWGWYLVQVAEAGVNRTDAIPDSGNSDVNGEDHAAQELNLLLVGMDSRAGLTAEQQAEFSTGNPEGALNTDSMMLVHVPADGSGASLVSLPRDTYVPVPGHDMGRLNSAYSRGYSATEGSDADKDAAGAQLLVRTVSQFTGLRIDHFAEIDLLGFLTLSSIVGGVEVNLCQATSDPMSGADFPAGVQTITGADALKFVRQRHGLPNVDLDRVVRQQVYVAGMLRNILSTDLLLDLGRQKAVVEQVAGSLTLDRELDLLDLAAQLQGVQPGNITFQTIPGLTPTRIDGADVLEPPGEEEVRAFFATLGATPDAGPGSETPAGEAPTVTPDSVTVSVLNGSGVSGAAATTADELSAAGFEADSAGNADPTDTTTVLHAPGDEAAAGLVAAQVPGAAVAVDDTLPAGTVQLVIGTDYEGIGRAVTAPAPVPEDPGTGRTADDPSCIN